MDADRSVDGSGDREEIADNDVDIEIFEEEEVFEHESASSGDETDEDVEERPIVANGRHTLAILQLSVDGQETSLTLVGLHVIGRAN